MPTNSNKTKETKNKQTAKAKKEVIAKPANAPRKRTYSAVTYRQIWIDSRGFCPICGEELQVLDIETSDQGSKDNSIGQIAHIVSLNNLGGKKPIRPANLEYEELKSVPSYIFENGRYTDLSLNHYNNLLVLCTSCHMRVDGKMKDLGEIKILDKVYRGAEFTAGLVNGKQVEVLRELKSNGKVEHKNLSSIPDLRIDSIEKLRHANGFINGLADEIKHVTIDSDSFANSGFSSYKWLVNIIQQSKRVKTIFSNILKDENTEKYFKNNFISVKFIGSAEVEEDGRMVISLNSNIARKKFSDDVKGFNEYKSEVRKYEKKNSSMKWLDGSVIDDKEIANSPEYKLLESLLFDKLNKYLKINEKTPELNKTFDSFSVAYMARWGTGKTSIIRKICKDLSKFFNFVEINLWYISNAANTSGSSNPDNQFVRHIVKEAITQLSSNPELVHKFMNTKTMGVELKRENDVRKNMLDSLIDIPESGNPEVVFRERSKFIDQHIYSITRITDMLFKNTHKPTIFLFDDIDRIEDENNIVNILDSLVAFLGIKNAVYIIPVDEAKIMRAIAKKKQGKDPYTYINKYFTHTIRAPFIPRLNSKSIIKEIIESLDLGNNFKWAVGDAFTTKAAALLPTDYRGVKDYLNVFFANVSVLEENPFFKKMFEQASINGKKLTEFSESIKYELILLTTIIQINYPLLIDYLSEDIKRKDVIFKAIDYSDSRMSDVSYIRENIDIINSDEFNEGNKKNSDIKLYTVSSKFWSSIFSIELSNIDHQNTGTLFADVKNINDKAEIKPDLNLIKEKLEKLDNLFKIFSIKTTNSPYRLLLWTALTLASIKDTRAIKFAEKIDYWQLSISNKIWPSLEELIMQNVNTPENKIDAVNEFSEFVDSIDGHLNDGFLDENEVREIVTKIISDDSFVTHKINLTDRRVIKRITNEMISQRNACVEKFTDYTNIAIWNHLNSSKIISSKLEAEITKGTDMKQIYEWICQFIAKFSGFAYDFDNSHDGLEFAENVVFYHRFIYKNYKKIKFHNVIPRDIVENRTNTFFINELLELIANSEYKQNGLKEVFFGENLSLISNEVLSKFEFKNYENLSVLVEINNDNTNLNRFSVEFLVKYLIELLAKKVIKDDSWKQIMTKTSIDANGTSGNILAFNNSELIDAIANNANITYLEIFEHIISENHAIGNNEEFITYYANKIIRDINLDIIIPKEVAIKFNDMIGNNQIFKALLIKNGYSDDYWFKDGPLVMNMPLEKMQQENVEFNESYITPLEAKKVLDENISYYLQISFGDNEYDNVHSLFKHVYDSFEDMNDINNLVYYPLPTRRVKQDDKDIVLADDTWSAEYDINLKSFNWELLAIKMKDLLLLKSFNNTERDNLLKETIATFDEKYSELKALHCKLKSKEEYTPAELHKEHNDFTQKVKDLIEKSTNWGLGEKIEIHSLNYNDIEKKVQGIKKTWDNKVLDSVNQRDKEITKLNYLTGNKYEPAVNYSLVDSLSIKDAEIKLDALSKEISEIKGLIENAEILSAQVEAVKNSDLGEE